jgi:peptidoglycan hydrolase-like protein with peptidoglycan-binding domain
MKKTISIILISLLAVHLSEAFIIEEEELFRSTDPLAQRDEDGLMHQSKTVYPPDAEPRARLRMFYYFQSGRQLAEQPAYVGSLQTALARRGYYCGPIDGVFSDDVSVAIAHMQKNCSMRVTGTITIPVRRALHLP